MSARITAATAARVLEQIRHDRRTIALLLVVPSLCGLLVPRDQMADWLDAIASVLPLTFAFDALDAVAVDGSDLAGVSDEVAVLVAMFALAIGLGALTLRRRTA
jgi:ABC-2 type transport system permease protein